MPVLSTRVSQILSAASRLGHMQEPFVLQWQQLPTATSNARVRQTLAAALSPGHGCLSLQEVPTVSYIRASA